jgi:hypothetical protein
MITVKSGRFAFTNLDPMRLVEEGYDSFHDHGASRRIDHAVQVVPSHRAVEDAIAKLISCGARLVEAPVVFPDQMCD